MMRAREALPGSDEIALVDHLVHDRVVVGERVADRGKDRLRALEPGRKPRRQRVVGRDVLAGRVDVALVLDVLDEALHMLPDADLLPPRPGREETGSRSALGDRRSASACGRMAVAPSPSWEEWLDQFPECVVDHGVPSQPPILLLPCWG